MMYMNYMGMIWVRMCNLQTLKNHLNPWRNRKQLKVMFMKLAAVIERIPNFGGASYEDTAGTSGVWIRNIRGEGVASTSESTTVLKNHRSESPLWIARLNCHWLYDVIWATCLNWINMNRSMLVFKRNASMFWVQRVFEMPTNHADAHP